MKIGQIAFAKIGVCGRADTFFRIVGKIEAVRNDVLAGIRCPDGLYWVYQNEIKALADDITAEQVREWICREHLPEVGA